MRDNVEIKKEKLRIAKEKLLLTKEMFQFFQNINSDYKKIFNNIDMNIMHLKEEVKKLIPSYI